MERMRRLVSLFQVQRDEFGSSQVRGRYRKVISLPFLSMTVASLRTVGHGPWMPCAPVTPKVSRTRFPQGEVALGGVTRGQ